MSDALRLAFGTFTAWPVPAPRAVSKATAARALLLAPLAALTLGALAAGVLWSGRELGLAPWPVAAVAVLVLALGSRGFHLDGLADTADGLTASYDRERSIAVMKTGDVGPAGAAAIVLILVVQIGSLASLGMTPWAPVAAALVVAASRAAASLGCATGVAGASTGIGNVFTGAVPKLAVAAQWFLVTAALMGAALLLDLDWWRGLVAAAVAVVLTVLVVARAVRRIGGVTGDILGASIEVGLAGMLLALT